MEKIQLENITCNQEYTTKIRIPDILKLVTNANGTEALLLIEKETTKCMEARLFLSIELSDTDYRVRDIDIVKNIKKGNFKNRMEFARNFIFCVRLKEMLSTIIKSHNGLSERYFLFISDPGKYYHLMKAKGAFNIKTINPELYQPNPEVIINKPKHSKTTKAFIRIENECFNWTCGEVSLKYEIKERPTVRIFTSEDVFKFMSKNVGIDTIQVQEHFFAIYMNHAREVIGFKTIGVGDINACVVNIRQVLCIGLILNAATIVVIHNHPSNTLIASNADIELTKNLIDASNIIGMPLSDHIILSSFGYLSMNDNKILDFNRPSNVRYIKENYSK